uniref:Integrase catalytic domain-containing protein n=1 Tax=Trichogramma kaykai TaxID=54128 RepID=A0ABD2WT57_9HYME
MADSGVNKNDDYNRVSVRRLKSEDQWETWKWQIELCLHEQGLYDIVSGGRECPDAPKDSAVASTAYKTWQSDNARAARILGTALEEDAAMYVRKKNNAKEIWDTLKSVYEQSSLQRLYTLFDTFYEIQKDDATSIKKHATHLSNVFDDIIEELKKKDATATLPASILHHRIFKTLSHDYQFYRSTWYRIPETEQTTNLLVENLVAIESSMRTQTPSSTASAFHMKASKFKQKENTSKKSTASSSNSERKEKRQCHYCKKTGHLIAVCQKRINAEKTSKGNSESDSRNNDYKPSTFLATSLTVNSDLVSSEAWISDSGATNHMSANRQHFATYAPFPIPQRVETANMNIILAYGCGNVDVQVLVDNKWLNAQLTDVWYVPEVGHQLFSVRQATKYGNKVIYDSDGVEIQCDNKVVATGRLEGTVYIMNMRVCTRNAPVTVNVATTEDQLQGWHERLGHQDKRHVRKILSQQGILTKYKDATSFCDGCVLGKSHRKPFHTRQDRPQKVGELINSDVNGPMSTTSIEGYRYYVVFKDDYSRYTRIFFMREKSEVAKYLDIFLNECDNHNHKVKIFRSGGGGEFDCKRVREILQNRGIELNLTCPYTPEQNGVSEQSNRYVVELARSMLTVSKMSKSFWTHACETATFLINRTGKSGVPDKSPIELWSGKSFKSFDYLRIFGSDCYVNIPKQFRSKFDDKAVAGKFIGYLNEKDGYKIWVPSKNRVVNSRNVDFRPEKLCTNDSEIELYLNSTDEKEENHIKNDDSIAEEFLDALDDGGSTEEENSEEEEDKSESKIDIQATSQNTRPVRKIHTPKKLADYEVGYKISNVTNRKANSAWACMMEAVEQDIEPTNFHDAVNCSNSDNWIQAMQEEMKAFEENQTWKLVHPPAGKHVIDNRWVLRIKYKPDGTVDRYRARLVARGMLQRAEIDYEETFSPVARYDSIRALIAIAANERLTLGQFDIKSAFLYGKIDSEIYMTQPQGFDDGSGRGHWTRSSSGFAITQRTYAKKILERFGMSECNVAKTPVINQQFSTGENDTLDEKIPYRSAVGSLMYLCCATSPDIAFAVSRAARALSSPTHQDWIAVKRIFRYIKGTIDFGLCYTSSTKGLCAYTDADYAGDLKTRRSTNGFVAMIGHAAVSWTSQLQKSVALSTTEAEFVAASEGAKELVWLNRLMSEINSQEKHTPTLFVDNASAIKLVKNHEFHKRTKHIEVRYYYIRELYLKGDIRLEHVCSEEQLGDMFTKPLTSVKFNNMCSNIGLRECKIY